MEDDETKTRHRSPARLVGPSTLDVLFLEPFYGGSHREFADGLVQHSRHQIVLHTLPARFRRSRVCHVRERARRADLTR